MKDIEKNAKLNDKQVDGVAGGENLKTGYVPLKFPPTLKPTLLTESTNQTKDKKDDTKLKDKQLDSVAGGKLPVDKINEFLTTPLISQNDNKDDTKLNDKQLDGVAEEKLSIDNEPGASCLNKGKLINPRLTKKL